MDALAYFNPRSREGSDGLGHGLKPVEIISIHAPVKGATDYYLVRPKSVKISIHAPVKGATEQIKLSSLRNGISIHAPVKGATLAFAV